ncbi:response regulator [Phenylobacterium sp.]|uniref:response regulator n=1 Tax=Phenylobacterium sp. TaxID=1871053 RepID=UPI002733A79F|nr:response regulator [Phenylobacterium sp.]MDP3852766.1 response regulator [Phenylobacterium sp.]
MRDAVLVVDDSMTVRMDLAEAFAAAGLEALPCASIAEARLALAGGRIGVVVLDVLLPDGDGVEFLSELRASAMGSDAGVMMLSTEAEIGDRIRGLRTGADEYVGKPYDTGYVVTKAREMLKLRRGAAVPTRQSILIIDDSVTFREHLREALEQAGYAVLVAGDGEEGLRVAADQRPSAIVVDGIMPGIGGATVVRRVRLDAALRGIPCLLLTALEDGGVELQAYDAGADAFVRKEDNVELILAKLAAMLRRSSQPPSEETASLMGPKRILAVDDSITYLQELAAALRDEGYDVVLARSGEEALQLLAVQPVDCILLDLLMPGLSGRETCGLIKAAPGLRDIPLIMLTAVDDRSAMLEGLGAGADDYIQKSSELQVLKARMRAQLRRKQFEDENRRIREELQRTTLEIAEARSERALAEVRAALIQELERKNEELEAFTYSVSHDLRSPLRSIDGFSQALLEDYADKLDDKGRGYLRRVRGAAQRMGELIDDLLQLSQINRMNLTLRPVDLSALARLVAADLSSQDPGRTVEVSTSDGLVIKADAQLMRIVLENLLGNAFKFTGKVSQPKVEIGMEQLADGPAYFVRDNGVGFDMNFADRLFGVFQRLHTQNDFPGTGIGLATVQRIMHRLGGRAWAESQPDAGATFYFRV